MNTVAQEEKLRMGDESALTRTKPVVDVDKLDPKTFKTPWTLHYKAVHHVASLNFQGPEDKEAAILLGHVFCSKRNWRFIQVRPFFTDILIDPQTEEERARFTRTV